MAAAASGYEDYAMTTGRTVNRTTPMTKVARPMHSRMAQTTEEEAVTGHGAVWPPEGIELILDDDSETPKRSMAERAIGSPTST